MRAAVVQRLVGSVLNQCPIEVLRAQEKILCPIALRELEGSWLFVVLRVGGREGQRKRWGYFRAKLRVLL